MIDSCIIKSRIALEYDVETELLRDATKFSPKMLPKFGSSIIKILKTV